MVPVDNDLATEPLPEAFCWTKFGTEAGEHVDSIFGRKEVERQRNGGVFLWGIGNSIKPSLHDLLSLTNSPQVVFSPMKSPAAKRDVAPSDLVLWRSGIGYDGISYTLPYHSVVTSRFGGSAMRGNHFALVCSTADPLAATTRPNIWLSTVEIRNLRTGSALGASQVTSVVRRERVVKDAQGDYPVTIRARLVYPYLVQLVDCVLIPESLRLDRKHGASLVESVEDLVKFRHEHTGPQPRFEQLSLV